jgi:NAD(P)-dependent dehydrogenase (short-subunit alcohol dehydrogenase family)
MRLAELFDLSGKNAIVTGGGSGLGRRYTASKDGVVSFSRDLAVKWAPHRIRVNAIAFLASRAGAHVTGQTLLVDGGQSSS